MNKIVFDSSALLSLLLEEKGQDMIKPLIKNSAMSTVNVAETLTVLKRIHIETQEALTSINSIIKEIVPLTMEDTALIADLHPLTKPLGLSLGDRACIALGITRQLPIYTADKIWKELKIEGADIRLIR